MKKIFGNLYRKLILGLGLVFIFQSAVLAYETVIVDFPNSGWKRVYHQSQKSQAIAQYVPSNQSRENCLETLVFHSYKWDIIRGKKPKYIIQSLISDVRRKYSDIAVTTVKNDVTDVIAVWCTVSGSQCEIVRATQGYEGIITMHYVNKNPQNFQSVYPYWYQIVSHIKVYYSYYRWNLMLQKPCTVVL